jgi:hypothetical protein
MYLINPAQALVPASGKTSLIALKSYLDIT